MASGRSARLPPTPAQRIIDVSPNSGYRTATVDNSEHSINALGPDLAVATSQVLESLSEREKQIIYNVLNRDEEVRQRDAARLM